jgi:hypothetical protein
VFVACAAQTVGLFPGLTAEQRAAIETTNAHHVEKLDLVRHAPAAGG